MRRRQTRTHGKRRTCTGSVKYTELREKKKQVLLSSASTGTGSVGLAARVMVGGRGWCSSGGQVGVVAGSVGVGALRRQNTMVARPVARPGYYFGRSP